LTEWLRALTDKRRKYTKLTFFYREHYSRNRKKS
jgi:hypothetical protein